MATMPTPLHLPETPITRELDRILRDTDSGGPGDGLDETVARLCLAGLNVRDIAARLTLYTGKQVSYRSVARWLREARAAMADELDGTAA